MVNALRNDTREVNWRWMKMSIENLKKEIQNRPLFSIWYQTKYTQFFPHWNLTDICQDSIKSATSGTHASYNDFKSLLTPSFRINLHVFQNTIFSLGSPTKYPSSASIFLWYFGSSVDVLSCFWGISWI